MLAYVCLLAFIGLGSCTELQMPSREDIESSINRTIVEVEKMIEDNPSLPRLDRSDIVNILYNITSKDVGSLEDEALKAIEKTREDYQRALMVVLPYKPTDDGESLRELYTKPPMVQIVQDDEPEPRKDSQIETIYSPNYYSGSKAPQAASLVETKHQLVTAHMKFDDTQKSANEEQSSTTTTTSTAKPTSNMPKTDSAPQKFTFNLNVKDQRPAVSHTSIATKRPIYKGTFSRYRTSYKPLSTKLEIIYSTKPPTTTLPTTTASPEIESTTVQNKPASNILSSDQWHYNAPPATSTTPKTVEVNDSPWKPMAPPSKDFFLPTIKTEANDPSVPNFADVKVEDFEKVMSITTPKTAPIFVTPSVMTIPKRVNNNVKNIPSGFKLTTTTTAPTSTMRQEVEVLLKSIGLQPVKITKQKNNIKSNQNNVEAQKNENINNNINDSNGESVITDLSKLMKNNSFEAPQLNVKNLSPDIQLLFQQFGLQMPGPESTSTTTTTPKPTAPTNVNSYTHFKPLPTSSVRDKDFRNFLARFGLGLGENRNKKAMESKQVTKRPSLLDAVPNNMRKILENIGLIKKSPRVEKAIDEEPKLEMDASKIIEQTTSFNEHIFKPHEGVVLVDDSTQKEKIKNLLNTVRMVQEGKADVQDVQKVAHELLQSTKTLANGPDPLKLEEILNNYRNSLKNEVKRQQEQTSTTAASTAKELNDSTLSPISSTESSVSTDESNKSKKTDQSSSSSTTDEKAAKPSFFDNFDAFAYLNQTESPASSSTSEAPASSGSTSKASFFDTFNVNDFTTTENSAKNANVNLGDLEESFGGSTAEPDPVLPTRPKTGFYFLLDWNSFLDVGEDGKDDKVSLRFSPKVGDRTRFIPVKIP